MKLPYLLKMLLFTAPDDGGNLKPSVNALLQLI